VDTPPVTTITQSKKEKAQSHDRAFPLVLAEIAQAAFDTSGSLSISSVPIR
jgi:hypothetical protein